VFHQKHCLTTVNLIALLSSGATPSDTRNHVDIVVHQGGIEACVHAMRAHQSGLAIARAVNNALTKIAAAPKGATAVATRGASRQLMRALALFSTVRYVSMPLSHTTCSGKGFGCVVAVTVLAGTGAMCFPGWGGVGWGGVGWGGVGWGGVGWGGVGWGGVGWGGVGGTRWGADPVFLGGLQVPSRDADDVVLSMLQVLDVVASRSAESADILRKQGIADAVIACIDCPKAEPDADKAAASSGASSLPCVYAVCSAVCMVLLPVHACRLVSLFRCAHVGGRGMSVCCSVSPFWVACVGLQFHHVSYCAVPPPSPPPYSRTCLCPGPQLGAIPAALRRAAGPLWGSTWARPRLGTGVGVGVQGAGVAPAPPPPPTPLTPSPRPTFWPQWCPFCPSW
jgi:hypothetical protein